MKGNHLSLRKKVQILQMLCDGSSMRSASRVVDCSLNTVSKLLREIGAKCDKYQYMHLRNLNTKHVQADEIWSFVFAKSKNLKEDREGGDIWTWTAIDSDSRLVICWLAGKRELDYCRRFMIDLASRLNNRVQLTTDGLVSYIQGVQAAFGSDIHYGQLVKAYENDELLLFKENIVGNPDEKKISTSLVERQNLSMRMGMRRFTRKTNAYSKKMENHRYALALYFFYHNFIRINATIRVTPAMETGITDHVWSWEDVLALEI